ncbi:MAG: hypothetical protein EBX40_04520, partial [Gammaproteobacteria bacterium]|nr:hypothetical protein [Gammaproteobacteria bacterium]
MNKRLPKSELGEVLFAVLIASSLGAILLSLLMQHLVGLLSWQQKLKQQADDQTRALYAITLIAHSLEMAMTLSESPTQHINLLPDSIRAVYDEPSVRITASPDPNLGLTKPGSGSYIRGSPVISIVQGKLPVVQVSILPRQSQFLFEHAKSLFKAGDVVWISNGQITVLDQIISAGEHQVSLLQPVPVALTGAWMMPIERNVFYLGLDALHHSA